MPKFEQAHSQTQIKQNIFLFRNVSKQLQFDILITNIIMCFTIFSAFLGGKIVHLKNLG